MFRDRPIFSQFYKWHLEIKTSRSGTTLFSHKVVPTCTSIQAPFVALERKANMWKKYMYTERERERERER